MNEQQRVKLYHVFFDFLREAVGDELAGKYLSYRKGHIWDKVEPKDWCNPYYWYAGDRDGYRANFTLIENRRFRYTNYKWWYICNKGGLL